MVTLRKKKQKQPTTKPRLTNKVTNRVKPRDQPEVVHGRVQAAVDDDASPACDSEVRPQRRERHRRELGLHGLEVLQAAPEVVAGDGPRAALVVLAEELRVQQLDIVLGRLEGRAADAAPDVAQLARRDAGPRR